MYQNSYNLSNSSNKKSFFPGADTEDNTDIINLLSRYKLDVILEHFGTSDLESTFWNQWPNKE